MEAHEIDKMVRSGGEFFIGCSKEEAELLRGRLHYSAKINNAEIKTKYQKDILYLSVTR